jgi:hypothetical protein
VESACERGNEPSGTIKCYLPSGCTTCGLSSGTQLHRVSLVRLYKQLQCAVAMSRERCWFERTYGAVAPLTRRLRCRYEELIADDVRGNVQVVKGADHAIRTSCMKFLTQTPGTQYVRPCTARTTYLPRLHPSSHLPSAIAWLLYVPRTNSVFYPLGVPLRIPFGSHNKQRTLPPNSLNWLLSVAVT